MIEGIETHVIRKSVCKQVVITRSSCFYALLWLKAICSGMLVYRNVNRNIWYLIVIHQIWSRPKREAKKCLPGEKDHEI